MFSHHFVPTDKLMQQMCIDIVSQKLMTATRMI